MIICPYHRFDEAGHSRLATALPFPDKIASS
jgi:hypothetical protein